MPSSCRTGRAASRARRAHAQGEPFSSSLGAVARSTATRARGSAAPAVGPPAPPVPRGLRRPMRPAAPDGRTRAAKLSANCSSTWSATMFIMPSAERRRLAAHRHLGVPTRRPAAAPRHRPAPPGPWSRRLPCCRCPCRAVAAYRRRVDVLISISPRKAIVAGPTSTVTVPLERPAASCSVIFAPGMQPATASMSWSSAQVPPPAPASDRSCRIRPSWTVPPSASACRCPAPGTAARPGRRCAACPCG